MLARLGIVAVLSATILGGCSAQDQRITRLDYVPSKAAAKTGGAPVGVAMPTEAHGLPVNKLGEPIVGDIVKQGGSASGHVLLVDSLPKWVGNAVTGELKAAGINAGLGLEPKPGRAIVKTEIAQLKNETKSQWSSNSVTTTIGLEFKVEKDGQNLGTVQAVGTGKVEAAAKLTDVMHQAMQMALHDALKKGAPPVVDILRKADQPPR
jgi:hypothetical protein